MDSYETWLRHPARALAVDAVLAEPVTALQGVTDDAARALATVGIRTVLDLGASALFAAARSIADAADRVDALGSPGPLAADLVDDAARGQSATVVAGMPPRTLRALGAAAATALEKALPAATIRDLGWWPPASNARRLVAIAYGGDDPVVDPEAPPELQPRMGRLPVDRTQYDVLLFEEPFEGTLPPLEEPPPLEGDPPEGGGAWTGPRTRGPDPVGPPPPLVTGAEFPLDPTPALLGQGFSAPGIGFVLTIAQSWYSVGLSLGQLIHSLALAPGEATRVAVVDWSRRVATRATEETGESEVLSQLMDRKRGVSEIARALAREAQGGFSGFETAGRAEGGSIGGAANYQDREVNVTAAGGYATTNNAARGGAFASSQGQREVGASMAQKVADRTQQFASLDRTRRASLVTEVSVAEAERLSTRVVANYNHMHALTVLYFEVVQLYRVLTECVAADPVLYLPVKPMVFTQNIVDRYRTVLAQAALVPAARDALLGVAPPVPPPPPAEEWTTEVGFFDPSFVPSVLLQQGTGRMLSDDALRAALGSTAELAPNRLRFGSRHARLAEVQVGTVDGTQRAIAESLEVETPRTTLSVQFEKWARPPKDPMRFLPDPGDSLTAFRAPLPAGWSRRDTMAVLRTTASWRWDTVLTSPTTTSVWPRVRYVLELLDPATGAPTGATAVIDGPTPSTDDAGRMRLVQLTLTPAAARPTPAPPTAPPFDLLAHLNANALHYTMALVRLADPSLVASLLASVRVAGGSLLGRVDPVPLATVGNYLVFRCPALATTTWWARVREARGLPRTPGDVVGRREALVPLASGGVFAEAVLGRFNSAERLDLSRFWNWQDSPPPLVPPEIAPLVAGGRAGATAPLAGALGSANLVQQQAPAVPDPTGALVRALEISGKGDAFRDMSAADRLLQNGADATRLAAQGATDFMKTAMETVTAYGARVNKGEEIDKRAKTAEAAAPGTSRGTGTGGGGGTPSGGSPASGTPGGSTEGDGATAASAPGVASRGGTGPNAPDSAERAAFRGPEPTENGMAAMERARTGVSSDQRRRGITRQEFTVQVTAVADGEPRVLEVLGTLDLEGLLSVESPGGAVAIPVRGGVGSRVLRLAPDATQACIGKLRVKVLESAIPEAVDVPGVPSRWALDQIVANMERRSDFRIRGGIFPPREGDGGCLIDVRTEFWSASAVRALALRAGVDTAVIDATLFEPDRLDTSMYPATSPLDATQLGQLRDRIAIEFNIRVTRLRALLSKVDIGDETPLAVVAFRVTYDQSSGQSTLVLTPRCAAIRKPVALLSAR